MTTNTTALAAAIADFEREFPDACWSVGRKTGALVIESFDVIASSFADDPVQAMTDITARMRERARRRRADAASAAMLDAEYGPEVAA